MRATVVTAAGLNLTVLVGTFGPAGITEAWVLSNDAGDRLLFDPAPDLIICVLDLNAAERTDPSPPGFTNLDVMIRAGQAAGRGVPTLIVAPPPLALSSPVADTDVVYCPLDRGDVLGVHVSAFVHGAQARARSEVVGSSRLISPQPFEAELRDLGSLYPEPRFHLGVEQLVAKLLREAGAIVPNAADVGADLAFFASADSPGVMLMEIKAGRLTEPVLSTAEAQLQDHVRSSSSKLGVLVYYDLEHKHLPSPQPREAVVRIPLEDLIEQLGMHELPYVIAATVAQRGSVSL